NQRLDLVGPRLGYLEAETAGLAVEQDDGGADAVELGDVSGNRRIIRGGPARHALLDEILVSLDGELAARHHLALGGIGVIGVRPIADAKTLERVGRGEEDRLAL